MDCSKDSRQQQPLPLPQLPVPPTTRSIRGFQRSVSDVSNVSEKFQRTLSFRRRPTFHRQPSLDACLDDNISSLSLHTSTSTSSSSQRSLLRQGSFHALPDKAPRRISLRRRPLLRRQVSLDDGHASKDDDSTVLMGSSQISLLSQDSASSLISQGTATSTSTTSSTSSSASTKIITEILPSLLSTILVLILTPFCRKSAPVQQILCFSRPRRRRRCAGSTKQPCILSRLLTRRPTRFLERHIPKLLPAALVAAGRRPGLFRRLIRRPMAARRKVDELVASIKGIVNSEMISVLAATSLFFSFLR